MYNLFYPFATINDSKIAIIQHLVSIIRLQLIELVSVRVFFYTILKKIYYCNDFVFIKLSDSTENIRKTVFFIRDFVTVFRNFLVELEGLQHKYGVNILDLEKQLPVMIGQLDAQKFASTDQSVLQAFFKAIAFFTTHKDSFNFTSANLGNNIKLLDNLTKDLESNVGPSNLVMTPTNLDPKLLARCIGKDYHDIITNAFPILEDRIRDKLSLVEREQKLLEEAFNPQTGKLELGNSAAEREGIYFLFRGAFSFLRNPPSHSLEKGREESDGLKVMYLVDLLLKIVEESKIKT